MVLTGTGRAFTAGQDLGEMAAPPDHGDGELHGYRGLIPVLEAFDKPLLAAVNGLALGIGATILPHCDIVWIAEGARLKVPFVTLGRHHRGRPARCCSRSAWGGRPRRTSSSPPTG